MQKHYFKYASGFINVDDANLYLTNSGNWQEARGLEEKGPATIKANDNRTSLMKGFVIVVVIAIGWFVFKMLSSKTYAIGVFAALGFMAYRVFEYLKHDFGNRYKIPLSKLIAIEPKGTNGLTIRFYNAQGKPDEETVSGIAPNGMAFLLDLALPITENVTPPLKS